MCGLAGIVGAPGDGLGGALFRMTRAQAHRGPDGEGMEWYSCGPRRSALATGGWPSRTCRRRAGSP